MTYIRISLLSLILSLAIAASAQPLPWIQGLESAQELAKRNDKPLLLFFTARDSAYSKQVNEWLEAPELAKTLSRLVLVRFDMEDNQRFANSLKVYRAGTIMLYRSNGDALAQITGIVTAEELSSEIQQALGPDATDPRSTPVAAAPNPVTTTNTEYLQLPKGPQVGKSITQLTSDSQPLRFGTLEAGKHYVLQMKGVFSTRAAALNGSDPMYNFFLPETPGKITKSTFVRFKDGDVKMATHLSNTQQPQPPYTLAHRYDIPIIGDGKELILQFHEATERNFTDNTGSITLTLFEGK